MTKRNSTGASASNQAQKRSTKKLNTEQFIARAIAVHGNAYDYSQVLYKNKRTKVAIICQTHGRFEQLPDAHINKGRGCKKCADKSRRLTTSSFVECSNKVHGNKYSYDKAIYKGYRREVVITCPIHGDFSQLAGSHINGSGCRKCSGSELMTLEYFIDRARQVHGDRYDYSLATDTATRNYIDIVCRNHGVFKQRVASHLKGTGCSRCADYGGFTLEDFVRVAESKEQAQARLYVLTMSRGSESFYKVGITTQPVRDRYRRTMPYRFDLLYDIQGDAEFVYNLEKELHLLLSECDYKPNLRFAGHTECFTTIKPIEKLLKELSTTEQLQLLA